MSQQLNCLLVANPNIEMPADLVPGLSEFCTVVPGSTAKEMRRVLETIDVIVVWGGVDVRALLEDIDPFPSRLRWISQAGIGVDKLLFPRLVESEIIVTNTRGVSSYAEAMAEFAFAGIMLFGKKLLTIERNRQQQHWDRVRHSLLRDQTVGVIGLGTIGREVSRRALAFGMAVLATKRNPLENPMPGVTVFSPAELDTVLSQSDYVVISAPLTSTTRALIGPREFGVMKPGAVLVNVARGAMVNEEALIALLTSGHLGGAALDVFAEEPLPPASPLWTVPNLFISPHMSAFTDADWGPVVASIVDNMKRYASGEPLQRVVDKAPGY